jgi:hypothetical protein
MRIGSVPVLVGVGRRLALPLLLMADHAAAQLDLGPEEHVLADGVEIVVPGYSVPSFVHFDGDELKDLIVGEGSGTETARVRIYLNVGAPGQPVFSDFYYAQSEGEDLVVPGSGCLGLFPRVVYWDADDRKDLLIGQSNGKIKLFLNVGTDDDPTFDGGTFLQSGTYPFKTDIDIGSRATPMVADWNNDGRKDLVAGAIDGLVRVFINEGTDTEPDFIAAMAVQADGENLIVPWLRSSPDVADLNGDGRKDLISGNTAGELLFYANVATDEEPAFSEPAYVESDGVPIDLPGGARSRPFLGDWNEDGLADVLIGAGDGLVRLFLGRAGPGDVNGDGVVDADDLLFLLQAWGPCPEPPVQCPADFDANDVVDTADLLILLAHWG